MHVPQCTHYPYGHATRVLYLEPRILAIVQRKYSLSTFSLTSSKTDINFKWDDMGKDKYSLRQHCFTQNHKLTSLQDHSLKQLSSITSIINHDFAFYFIPFHTWRVAAMEL